MACKPLTFFEGGPLAGETTPRDFWQAPILHAPLLGKDGVIQTSVYQRIEKDKNGDAVYRFAGKLPESRAGLKKKRPKGVVGY